MSTTFWLMACLDEQPVVREGGTGALFQARGKRGRLGEQRSSSSPQKLPPPLVCRRSTPSRRLSDFLPSLISDWLSENGISPPVQALHTFQEVLDAELQWGPDVAYELIKTSLDLAAALGGGPAQHAEHPEHAKQAQQAKQDLLDVAHTLLEKFEESGEEGGRVCLSLCFAVFTMICV